MKRSGPPVRRTPMPRGKGLTRTPWPPAQPKPHRRRRSTGPTAKVRGVVHARSGDRCEWPGCPNGRAEVHHRLNRKDGGRHGEMGHIINQPAWLLDACGHHHRAVTSAFGAALNLAKATGWVLMEGQDARVVPVLTRHHSIPVLLDDAGDWTPYGASHTVDDLAG